MTKEEATQFNYKSALNAAILKSVAPDCDAYVNWFTYRRWKAQGFQVAKGSKGTRLTTYVKKETFGKDNKLIVESIPRTTVVFNRHQLA